MRGECAGLESGPLDLESNGLTVSPLGLRFSPTVTQLDVVRWPRSFDN